jgi:hypothetical protein
MDVPAPTLAQATNTTRLAILRAQGPSLGSICASALTLTLSRSTLFLLRSFRRIATPAMLSALPLPIPPIIQSTVIAWLIAMGEARVLGTIIVWLGTYGGGADVQVLVGIGGESVWLCSKKVPVIIGGGMIRRGRGRKSTGRECKPAVMNHNHGIILTFLMFFAPRPSTRQCPACDFARPGCLRCHWRIHIRCTWSI